jgi:hypothetical protein
MNTRTRIELAILRLSLGIYARWHRLTPWERVRAVGMAGQYLSWCGSVTAAHRTGASAIRTFARGRILRFKPQLPLFHDTSARVRAMQLVGGTASDPPASVTPADVPARARRLAHSGGADRSRPAS